MVQAVAVAIAGGLRVDNRAKVPLSPTYAGILARAAFRAAQQICPGFGGPKTAQYRSRLKMALTDTLDLDVSGYVSKSRIGADVIKAIDIILNGG